MSFDTFKENHLKNHNRDLKILVGALAVCLLIVALAWPRSAQAKTSDVVLISLTPAAANSMGVFRRPEIIGYFPDRVECESVKRGFEALAKEKKVEEPALKCVNAEAIVK